MGSRWVVRELTSICCSNSHLVCSTWFCCSRKRTCHDQRRAHKVWVSLHTSKPCLSHAALVLLWDLRKSQDFVLDSQREAGESWAELLSSLPLHLEISTTPGAMPGPLCAHRSSPTPTVLFATAPKTPGHFPPSSKLHSLPRSHKLWGKPKASTHWRCNPRC